MSSKENSNSYWRNLPLLNFFESSTSTSMNISASTGIFQEDRGVNTVPLRLNIQMSNNMVADVGKYRFDLDYENLCNLIFRIEKEFIQNGSFIINGKIVKWSFSYTKNGFTDRFGIVNDPKKKIFYMGIVSGKYNRDVGLNISEFEFYTFYNSVKNIINNYILLYERMNKSCIEDMNIVKSSKFSESSIEKISQDINFLRKDIQNKMDDIFARINDSESSNEEYEELNSNEYDNTDAHLSNDDGNNIEESSINEDSSNNEIFNNLFGEEPDKEDQELINDEFQEISTEDSNNQDFFDSEVKSNDGFSQYEGSVMDNLEDDGDEDPF